MDWKSIRTSGIDVGKVYFPVCQKVSKSIKSYLFAAFLYPYNGWFVLSSLVVKPFILGHIWRLKGPYISNFCVIFGQVFFFFFLPWRKLQPGWCDLKWRISAHAVFGLCSRKFKAQDASAAKIYIRIFVLLRADSKVWAPRVYMSKMLSCRCCFRPFSAFWKSVPFVMANLWGAY